MGRGRDRRRRQRKGREKARAEVRSRARGTRVEPRDPRLRWASHSVRGAKWCLRLDFRQGLVELRTEDTVEASIPLIEVRLPEEP
jgi:hypothetical protein